MTEYQTNFTVESMIGAVPEEAVAPEKIEEPVVEDKPVKKASVASKSKAAPAKSESE